MWIWLSLGPRHSFAFYWLIFVVLIFGPKIQRITLWNWSLGAVFMTPLPPLLISVSLFLPVQTSFFLPPLLIREASLTLNLCFCITGLVCFFPPCSLPGLILPRSSFPAVEIKRGEPTAASLSALCVRLAFFQHKTANKQCGNKKRGMRGEWCVHPNRAILKLWSWKPLCLLPP